MKKIRKRCSMISLLQTLIKKTASIPGLNRTRGNSIIRDRNGSPVTRAEKLTTPGDGIIVSKQVFFTIHSAFCPILTTG